MKRYFKNTFLLSSPLVALFMGVSPSLDTQLPFTPDSALASDEEKDDPLKEMLISGGVGAGVGAAGAAVPILATEIFADETAAAAAETEQNHPVATILWGAAIGAGVGVLGNLATEKFLKGDKDGSGGPSGFGGGDFNFDPNHTDSATQASLNRAVDGLRRAEEGLGGRDQLVDVLNNPDRYLTDEDKAKLASMADSALGGSSFSPDAYYGDPSQTESGEDPYSFMGNRKEGDVSHRLSYLTDSLNGKFPAGGIPGVYAYNQGGRPGSGGLFGSGGSGLDANGLLSSFFPNKNGAGGSLGSGGMRSLAATESNGKGEGTGNGAYSLPDGAPLIFQAVHYYTPRFVQYNQLKQAQAKMEDEARAKRLLSAASPGNDATTRAVSARETMIVSQPLSNQATIGITAGAPLGVGIKVEPFPPDVN